MFLYSFLKKYFLFPNQLLASLFNLPIIFLGMYINLMIFKTILELKTSKKQELEYILFSGLWSTFCNIFLPEPLGIYINCFILIGIVMSIFKTRFLKSLIISILPIATTTLFETIICKIYSFFLIYPYKLLIITPIYTISFHLQIYFIMYIIYLLIRRNNFVLNISDNFSKNTKIQIFINTLLAFLIIGVQFYTLTLYSNLLPIAILILLAFIFTIFFFVCINNIIKISKLEITYKELEQSKEYNKTLEILYDSIRAFRHDFNNIIQTIGGFANSNDIEGLKSYYKDLFIDCQKTNNLAALNPNIINNSGLYCLLTTKYRKAEENGIKIHIDFFLNMDSLNMKIYEFTRILGILLDNAIEASSVCENKIINVIFNTKNENNMQYVLIENTYNDLNIDTEKIFEKGFSSKPKNTGLGLWEVRQILNKNKNLNLFTSKDDTFFKQQLEIFQN